MIPNFRKLAPVDLRSIGCNEKWLQDRLREDPGILGLGPLEIIASEHRQPLGGRLDFLMRDIEAETFFEVEIMLGRLDESHIIRTIEYWDIERQRRPNFEHRAVIVAEQITGRFFNIIRLLNRSVPIIAVQISGFKLDDGTIGLLPVTVLNINEEISDLGTVDPSEQVNRVYWERKNTESDSLGIVDQFVTFLREEGIEPRVTYNRHHIALGSKGYNFCWFNPRRRHCRIELRIDEYREPIVAALVENGVDATARHAHGVYFGITKEEANRNATLIKNTLKTAEEQSVR